MLDFEWVNPEWRDGPGLYRIRAAGKQGLQYIGESASVLPRLRTHAKAGYRTVVGHSRATTPRRTQGVDWRLGTQLSRGARIEVSWTLCRNATELDLLKLKDELIKMHAKVLGRSPIWQTLSQINVSSFATKEERAAGARSLYRRLPTRD